MRRIEARRSNVKLYVLRDGSLAGDEFAAEIIFKRNFRKRILYQVGRRANTGALLRPINESAGNAGAERNIVSGEKTFGFRRCYDRPAPRYQKVIRLRFHNEPQIRFSCIG
jgi:hypothetical protein